MIESRLMGYAADMSLLRLEVHARVDAADAACRCMVDHPYTLNITRLSGASIDPLGDLVSCDVPREAANELIERLELLGVTSADGAITITSGLTHLGDRPHAMEHAARGSASDAIVWGVIEDVLDEEVELSITFLSFMVLATMLAVIGVVTNSAILVVGAMVIGPEFGPLANFCVSVLRRAWRSAGRAWLVVTAAFLVATGVGVLLTAALRGAGVFPAHLAGGGLVQAVASPSWLTLIIAMIAGAAGMLSLTSARAATLVGVLISVTTVPAAGDAAVLFVYGDTADALGALVTLAINLTGIAFAGTTTLAVQRSLIGRLHREASP